jgi:enterochelin esterase family protein
MRSSLRRLVLTVGVLLGTGASVLVALSLSSATSAADTPPPSAAAPLTSCNGPTVNADRTVTFCLTAPQATSVALNLQNLVGRAPAADATPMTKQDNGIWVLTTPPLDPRWYGYAFTADGVQLPDPANRSVSFFQVPPVWPGPSSAWSWVLVSGPATDYLAEADVPHGLVSTVYYKSSVLKSKQQMMVYTPPGYTARDKRSYPVLYLYPGGGGADTDWPVNMRANFIMDNLIAQGKAKRMIVVMPEYNLRNCADFTNDVFPQQLVNDVVSTTEKLFRVDSGSRNRALAGLSSGGGCVYNTLFQEHQQFAYFGLFSPNWPVTARDDLVQNHHELLDSRAINKDVKLLYITKGGDSDSVTVQVPDHLALLDQNHIKYSYVPGTTYGAVNGHVWDTWSKALTNFAPRLFRK